jgi:hypothetical protein
MLYNPQWNDPYSITCLISWLEAQDPLTFYNPHSVETCLLARFAEAMGSSDVSGKSQFLALKHPYDYIAFGLHWSGAYTFGAALERAKQERN